MGGHGRTYSVICSPEKALNIIFLKACFILSDDVGWGSKGVGTTTGIDYLARHAEYRKLLIMGRHTSPHVIRIFKVWNDTVFPPSQVALQKRSATAESTVDIDCPPAPLLNPKHKPTTAELLDMMTHPELAAAAPIHIAPNSPARADSPVISDDDMDIYTPSYSQPLEEWEYSGVGHPEDFESSPDVEVHIADSVKVVSGTSSESSLRPNEAAAAPLVASTSHVNTDTPKATSDSAPPSETPAPAANTHSTTILSNRSAVSSSARRRALVSSRPAISPATASVPASSEDNLEPQAAVANPIHPAVPAAIGRRSNRAKSGAPSEPAEDNMQPGPTLRRTSARVRKTTDEVTPALVAKGKKAPGQGKRAV